LKANQDKKIRVIVLIDDAESYDDQAFQQLSKSQFLKGYAESDSIYDNSWQMSKLNFGDIVLLRFPFTNTQTYRRRPALLINDFNDADLIVCRITSQIYNTKNDV